MYFSGCYVCGVLKASVKAREAFRPESALRAPPARFHGTRADQDDKCLQEHMGMREEGGTTPFCLHHGPQVGHGRAARAARVLPRAVLLTARGSLC